MNINVGLGTDRQLNGWNGHAGRAPVILELLVIENTLLMGFLWVFSCKKLFNLLALFLIVGFTRWRN